MVSQSDLSLILTLWVVEMAEWLVSWSLTNANPVGVQVAEWLVSWSLTSANPVGVQVVEWLVSWSLTSANSVGVQVAEWLVPCESEVPLTECHPLHATV